MKSLASKRTFVPIAQEVASYAAEIVAAIPDPPEGESELRCHEVARVVHALLMQKFAGDQRLGPALVIDGYCNAISPQHIDHSWIEFKVNDASLAGWPPAYLVMILDVYVPGSLPQVRLMRAAEYRQHYTPDTWLASELGLRAIGPLATETLLQLNLRRKQLRDG